MDFAEECVSEFIEKFEASRDPSLWEKLVIEETDELLQATADLIKEACDLAYVIQGHVFALNGEDYTIPEKLEVKLMKAYEITGSLEALFGSELFETAFRRVHASNMSKLGSDGKPIRRSDGKIIKGPNYKPPELLDLI